MATPDITQKPSPEELAHLVLQQVERLADKVDRVFALFYGASALIPPQSDGTPDPNVSILMDMGFERLGDVSELQALKRSAAAFLGTAEGA